MRISIRKFLLINLLLAITITTTLTAIGNYYLDQKDIQEHLDSLMAVSTMSYQSLLGNDINQRDLKHIQKSLENIPDKLKEAFKGQLIDGLPPEAMVKKFNLQVWSNNGKLLLHSPYSPLPPLTSEEEGFSDKTLNGQDWRIFTAYNPKAGIRTVVAEGYNTRNELGHRIAQDDLYIMLLTFPLSGLLIWIIIGKGLDSLDAVAKEVANRAPSHLQPVDLEGVPDEIRPVIDELNKLFTRLQQAFDREKRFAADAAHELRTPLAALKAHAQVAMNTTSEQERQIALQKLSTGVDRSTHIVQQLLTMSRLVPESPTINDLVDVNLTSLACEIVALLAPVAIEKGTDIELKNAEETLFVKGNYTALSILIRNLVDNAIRYTPKNGKVVIEVAKKGKHVTLSVSDNGPGIPTELRARVFERFYRVLGNKSPGSGLGLSIVSQIAQLHEAKVKLLTTKGSETGLCVQISFTH